MKRDGLLLTIFAIVSILGFIALLLLNKYHNVYAFELEKIGEINEQIENGYISHLEENPENRNPILRDVVAAIEGEEELIDEDRVDNMDYENNDNSTMENNSYDNFKIMVIFCFGLSVGVIVGHFLTGFIK